MPDQITAEQAAIIKELSGRGDLNPEQQAIVSELMNRIGGQQPEPPSEQRSLPQEFGRQTALTGRYLLEGTAGTLGMITDPIAYGLDKIPGYSKVFGKYMPLKEIVSQNLSSLGVAEPESEAEKIIGEISTAIAGAGSGAGIAGTAAPMAQGVTQGVAQQMAAQPGAQLAGAASGAAAQQAAERAGLGPAAQFAANIVGGAAGAGATQLTKTKLGPKSIPEGMAEAQQNKIRVLTEDVNQPQTSGGKIVQSAMGKIAAGTGGQRAAQQAERTAAAQNLVRQYGADVDSELNSSFLNKVYEDLVKKREFKTGKYNQLKRDVIDRLDDKGTVAVDKTISKIDAEMDKIREFDDTNPLISFFEDFKNKIKNKSLNSIEELRKDLGDEISNASKNPQNPINKRRADSVAKKVYAALNEDMGDFIKQNGEPKDYNKWRAGNKKLSDMISELEVGALKRTLNNGEATPETIKTMLFSDKPSVSRTLYRNLTPKGKAHARTALIQEALFRTSKGRLEELSPDIFKNKIRDLQRNTGIFFHGEDRAALNGLYKALKLTEQAGRATAAPATGQQNLPVLINTVLGGLGAGGGGAVGGPVGAMAGAVGLPIAIGSLSRIYNSPTVRDALLTLNRLKISDPEAARAAKRLISALQAQQNNEQQQEPAQ